MKKISGRLRIGYTDTVKLKSRILESRVARIFEDYATGRLWLRAILALLKPEMFILNLDK